MKGSNNSDAIVGFVMGQTAGNARAVNDEIAAMDASTQASIAMMKMGALQQQVDAWRARFQRERSTRRGHQQSRMAAQALIQKLANVDRAGAQKLIDQAYVENKAAIEASIQKVDEWNFTGVEPGKH